MTSAIQASGVSQSTYQKIYSGSSLDFQDVLNLVQRNVPTHYIISALQSTEHVYRYSPQQLSTLKRAGAAPQLLNYLSETNGFYGQESAAALATATSQGKRPYRYSRWQLGAPFVDYDVPEVSTWYDSSYEESLYSPFSFD